MMELERAPQCTFEFSRREHVRACRAIHRHAIHRRWLRLALRVGWVMLAALAMVNIAANFGWEQFPAMLALLVWLAVWPSVPTLTGYAQARQWEKLNPPGNRDVTITVGEDAFRSASYVGSADVRWAAVKQVVETPEFLLIYVTDRIAHYLPRRAIPDGALPEWRRLIASRVDSGAVRLLES
jgi:hypothetical protein